MCVCVFVFVRVYKTCIWVLSVCVGVIVCVGFTPPVCVHVYVYVCVLVCSCVYVSMSLSVSLVVYLCVRK